jgi:multiple sugar transport system ATP-binding protein
MVFQNYALYPNMTVYQNLSFGLKAHRVEKKEIDKKVRTAAEMLQIDHLLDRRPAVLSGGQKQRVAIGSAIVRDAQAYLLDEPLSNLDAKLRSQMRVDLKKIFDKLQATMIYVTHDQVEAMTLATRIVVMNEGVVQQAGTPQEIYENPVNRFVAGFIGLPQMNFLEADLVRESGINVLHAGSFTIPLPARFQNMLNPDRTVSKVEIGIRPEDLSLHGDLPYAIPFVPDLVENLGSHVFVYGNSGSHRMTVRLDAEELDRQSGSSQLLQKIKHSSPVQLFIRPDRLHLFDPETGMSLEHIRQSVNGGNENEHN